MNKTDKKFNGLKLRLGIGFLVVFLVSSCTNPLVEGVIAARNATVWSKVIAAPATVEAANHSVTLSWPGTAGATSYNLYWSNNSNPTPATATKIRNVSSPYVHEGLTNEREYYYLLTASIPEGESKPSAVTKAKPMQTVIYVNSFNRVNIYPVDNTTGTLGALVNGPNFGTGQISNIAVDTARKYAYLADRYNAKVYSYKINSDTGVLTSVGSPVVSTGSEPSYIVIDSSSGYVYVVNTGAKNIMGYRVNSLDGSLTGLGSEFPVSLANEQINGVSISPYQPFIYFSTYDFNSEPFKGHIYSRSINTSTGELSIIGSTEIPCFPGSIVFDSTGDFLYVTNQSYSSYSVDMYSYPVISSSGYLGARVANTINWLGQYQNMRNTDLAVDPLGRFLFVGGFGGVVNEETSLTVFKINNGTLSVVPVDGKDSLPISYEPGYMAVDTNGHCLYVVNGSKIESYSINQTTGALTWMSTTETLVSGDEPGLGYYLIRDITVVSLP